MAAEIPAEVRAALPRQAPRVTSTNVFPRPSKPLPPARSPTKIFRSRNGSRSLPMTEQLADKKCVPCRGGTPPLQGKELEEMRKFVPNWTVSRQPPPSREYS